MSSKNGTPELVSMLQYMKKTYIENPEILVKDSRLLELDEIVKEVKKSEEWEAVKMNILEIGKEIGIELGEKQQFKKMIQKMSVKGYSVEEIAALFEVAVEQVQLLVTELESEKH